MNKLASLFFVILLVIIIALYNVFSFNAGDDSVDNKDEITYEKDPMTRDLVQVDSPNNDKENDAAQDDVVTENNDDDEFNEDEDEKDEERIKEEELRKKKEKEEKIKKEKKEKEKKSILKNKQKIDKVIRYAKTKLGKPYKQAGISDGGYDCSGLIMTSYAKYNVRLPRASYQMANKGSNVSLKNAKQGDLVFFATKSNAPKRISHVGLVTKVKKGKIYFIHSQEKVGVVVNSLDEGYYKKRFIKIKRYLKDD